MDSGKLLESGDKLHKQDLPITINIVAVKTERLEWVQMYELLKWFIGKFIIIFVRQTVPRDS
jgi:hypothetical protein